MRNATSSGRFKWCKIGNEGLEVSILQYADDTIFVGEATWENLWVIMKSVLRCFELVSGLKVNYKKTRLIGVNVAEDFNHQATVFLHCKSGPVHFKYLGLPVGANPRSVSTWEPIIQSMEKKLVVWKDRFLSFGGRVTLINPVSNSIPIYFLSYLRIPKKVLKILINIQRNFFWRGSSENRKIAWVRWETICKPREIGGLGIKNVEWFNLALLAKWRWRLLTEKRGLWRDILKSRYGVEVEGSADLGNNEGFKKGSGWWKGICRICRINNLTDWFQGGLKRKIGIGNKIRFWEDVWYGPNSFKDIFPRLYMVSNDKNSEIQKLGEWVGEHWVWNLSWRRSLFAWEQQMWAEFSDLVFPASPLKGGDDIWEWSNDGSRSYTSKSGYKCLQESCQNQVEEPDATELQIFKQFWKVKAPSKVLALTWKAVDYQQN